MNKMNKYQYLNYIISAVMSVGVLLMSLCATLSVLFILTSILMIVNVLYVGYLGNPDLNFVFDIVAIGNMVLGFYVFYRVYRFFNFHVHAFRLFIINFILSEKQRHWIRKKDLKHPVYSRKKGVE